MPVQWGTNPAVSQSVFLLRGTHAARPAAAPANQDYYYWEDDTPGGALFQSTGSAWVQLIGGAQSDGAGGTTLPGPITVNSETADAASTFSSVNGSLSIDDVPGNEGHGGRLLVLFQGQPLSADSTGPTAVIFRLGALNGHQYTGPMLSLQDFTASSGALMEMQGLVGGIMQVLFNFSRAGGFTMFGAPPLNVQPVGGAATAGGTYTATEKTMLQAVYDAARAVGMLS